MASSSVATCTFHVDRSVNGVVTLTIKTHPGSTLGRLALFFVMAAGLFLTAILGSYSDDIRASGGPTLTFLLGFLVFAGVGIKIFVAWSARKTSGSLSFDPAARTLSHHGLEWLFVSPQFQLPPDAVLGLDAITIRERRVSESMGRQRVLVRLWLLPAEGRSADEMSHMVEGHRQRIFSSLFLVANDAPLPAGATVLGTAFENPIFRRLASLLVECDACTAYDATGAATALLSARPRKTAVIAPPERFVIPTMGMGLKIFVTLFATVVVGFISLVSVNPFLFVYLWLLIVMALSTRQILVVDYTGVRLQVSSFFGLWRRESAERRWDEITTIQIEKAPNGTRCLAIRREDGDNLQIMLPGGRAGAKIVQRLTQLVSSGQQA